MRPGRTQTSNEFVSVSIHFFSCIISQLVVHPLVTKILDPPLLCQSFSKHELLSYQSQG